MKKMNFAHITSTGKSLGGWIATAIAAVALAACGGSDDPTYARVVVFGDSLSDVGTYATPAVKQLGGGKYTINGADSKIWVELLAERAGAAKPCAAQTGLLSTGPLVTLAAPATTVANCYGYAQGGARVTNPVGPGNQALLGFGNTDGYLGQLTVPLATQVDRHLAVANNRFSGSELVTVLAGGNDVFMNLGTLSATVAGGGNANAAATAAVTAMGVAGSELATLVRTKIVANGAQRVVVLTLPDISQTPFGLVQNANTKSLLTNMVVTFNTQLINGLAGVSGLLVVDSYAAGQAIAAAPANFGIANATTPACDARAQLGSLSCTAQTTLVGIDVSKYQYADSVHPSPLGYQLIAQSVIERMVAVGWL